MSDPVNHPAHYTQVPGVECIDVTRHFSFCRGNAIKYVWRAGAKGSEVEDLRKAIWYLRDELRRLGAPDAQEAAENAEIETLRDRVRTLEILNEGHVESWRAVQTALGGCSGKSLRDATLDAIADAQASRRHSPRLARELADAERDWATVCESLGAVIQADGHAPEYADAQTIADSIREVKRAQSERDDYRTPHERAEWSEDVGPALWWRLPVTEPPYAGTPLDDDFPSYVTHWTRIPEPYGAET